MSDKNASENRSPWDDYLNSSREELLNAKTSPIQRYIFDDQEKTVLAEYTFGGRKYVVTESTDQSGIPKKEVFILGEGDRLLIPEADDRYYGILMSIAKSQVPHDVII